jgi:hypothetical protein
MKLEIHVHIHHSATLEAKVDKILSQQEKMMATIEEIRQELVEINEVTNEMADDVNDLINRVPDGAGMEEIKSSLVSLKGRLQGIASQHTPNSTPPVEG